MTWERGARAVLGAIGAVMAVASGAAAQANDEVFPQLKWNFSTPGARANGMGTTFIGIADDATATVANPAGLVRLTRPQVYFEYKNVNLEVNRLANVDAFITLEPTTFSTNVSSLSFLSASMPIGERLAVGFTRHEFLNYQETFSLAPRGVPATFFRSDFALFPVEGEADFRGVTWAGTVSLAVTDRFDVGFTFGMNQLSAESLAQRTAVEFGAAFPSDPSALFGTGIIANETSIDDSDSAPSFGFGALYRASETLSVGFNFVKGPRFTVSETRRLNPGFPDFNSLPLIEDFGFPKDVSINVPNRIGVGVAYRPVPRLLVGVDAVRIGYSSLVEDFTLIFDYGVLTGDEYTIDDVTEVHVGAEYNVITGSSPVFIRAGFFTNPNHSVRFNGTAPPLDQDPVDVESAVNNSLPRKAERRGTVGAGFALGLNFQVDLAYVIGRDFVASAAMRF